MHFSGKLMLGKDRKEKGIALILVLWVMVLLTTIVAEFAYSMRTETNIAKNFKEEQEAYYLALAGIEQAKAEILSAEDITYLNEKGIVVFGQEEENLKRESKLGAGTLSYTITDEDGKLNINTASDRQLRYILESSGVDGTELDTIVDSIIDWRDPDDLHRLNGAEEDYYRSLPKPYSCKNEPFDTVEELILVKGITYEILYGSRDEEDMELKYRGIAQYLTAKSSNKININTAPGAVLEAYYGLERADNILRQREGGHILSPISKLRNGTVKSTFFTITSTGTNRDGTIKRTVKTIVRKGKKTLEALYWNDNFF